MDMMAGTVLYRENETIRSYKNRDSLVDVGCLGWLLLIGSRVAFSSISLPSNLVDGQSPFIELPRCHSHFSACLPFTCIAESTNVPIITKTTNKQDKAIMTFAPGENGNFS